MEDAPALLAETMVCGFLAVATGEFDGCSFEDPSGGVKVHRTPPEFGRPIVNTDDGRCTLPMTSPRVKAELARLVVDAVPETPASLRGLLEYLIPQARQGVAPDDLAIARDVFGRADGFDPEVDPIVRIQINRLRRKLQDHYESRPSATRIVIEREAVHLSARGPALQDE
jgi:hypothetical protein